ncbi:dNTP triphosphohydrolase [Mesorhizobium sp. B2-3-13]|uniref:dGTP triphosphohydrolase n=1 Tax=Mesorhizobium sp. B2-3-13 TaxID=2589951 RepID=UPI0011287807|nr:dNTP triphosphohydrolase [Mesorhizobium sp. B2-3-13]TPL76247.1 dNTP triphosphohydrolase [Mesorhizobium sp. B2-3-13]
MEAGLLANLWSTSRRGDRDKGKKAVDTTGPSDVRTPFEHDYDRLMFSTPVRRMADKTQVFPLEKNDGVRTRLTHSYEVANLARSIGNRLVRTKPGIFGSPEGDLHGPTVLATVGLAHDLGNPPFGHQGENEIRRWFEAKSAAEIFMPKGMEGVLAPLQHDFLKFEGNAQTLRLLSCLQVSSGGYGLDLTATTLAAVMKYTAPAAKAGKGANASLKKPGFMRSEAEVVEWVRNETGLQEGQRHPLTWLMEACDDIAYSVLDVEDAIKKSIVSAEDVLAYLHREANKNECMLGVAKQLTKDFEKADAHASPTQAKEIKASYLRTRLIEALVVTATSAFIEHQKGIFDFSHQVALLDERTPGGELYEKLKGFAKSHAYNHPTVLRTEHLGAVALSKLLDWFWEGITDRQKPEDPLSRRRTAFGSYVYALISDNYRHEFEVRAGAKKLPLRYTEMQLLTDMVSGMTDGFAMELFADLEHLRNA